VAAFAQVTAVGRGSNTCVYVIAIFTMCVPNNAFASSFVLKSEKPQRKCINYCSKHTVKMQWVVHKCLTGSVDLKRVESPLKAIPARDDRQHRETMISKVRTIVRNNRRLTVQEIGMTVRRLLESVRRKRLEKWRNGTGSCTRKMCPHTLHILCSSFWPNTAPFSCSSCHTHQIAHHVTFSYSQGLRNF